MAYATVDDLQGYVTTVPSTAAVLLDRCSRDVDRALLCAVYDPTSAAVQEALRAATCEQAAGYLAEGKAAGLGSGIASFTIGKISVGRGKGQGGSGDPAPMVGGLYEQAWSVLQLAGLTGQGPQTL